MQVGQRETKGLDAVLEDVVLDWPSLMTRRQHLRQEGRLNAANSALHGSEQECHRCKNRPTKAASAQNRKRPARHADSSVKYREVLCTSP